MEAKRAALTADLTAALEVEFDAVRRERAEKLKADLDEWRLRAPAHPSNLVFASRTNGDGPWLRETYKSWTRKSFKVAAEAAGRPDLRPYDLRHSMGTAIYLETGDIRAAQAILRHRQISTTLRYTHAGVSARVTQARDAFARHLGGKAETPPRRRKR